MPEKVRTAFPKVKSPEITSTHSIMRLYTLKEIPVNVSLEITPKRIISCIYILNNICYKNKTMGKNYWNI